MEKLSVYHSRPLAGIHVETLYYRHRREDVLERGSDI